MPLAHKDMYYDAGHVATCGSLIRRDFVPTVTSTALQRLKDAGQVRLGTLHLAEFAYGPTGHNAHYGPVRNPWNVAHITGGSSSGSGSSVAARLTYAALGSDTGGSIRMPAHFCGVTGLKTTVGRVSRAGAMPLSQQREQVLCVVEGIAGVTAIPQADVKKTVGAEGQLTALVVGERLVYHQQDPLAVRVGLVGVPGAGLELGNDGLRARGVPGVVYVELAIGAVVGMEGQTQQSLFLSIEVHQALDVQKISRQQGTILDDADSPGLLHHEKAAVARRAFQTEWES